ncbi:MAG: hypothetical protein WA981_04160 [Glaciecola sp.]
MSVIKLWLTVILIGFVASVSAGQVDTVGFGLIENNDVGKGRQTAIDDAKRLAVEQLLGSYISARTETENFMVASEKIYVTTKGKLDRFDILEENRVDSLTYQVKIRAYTDSKAIASQALSILKQNKWTKKPRVKLLASANSSTNEGEQALAAVVANVGEQLGKQGFIVLHEDSILGASFELKLTVSASAKQNDFQGMSISSNQMSVSGGLYNSATQDRVASLSFSDKQAGDASEALIKMSAKMAKRISQKVGMETRFAWLSEVENPVVIEVINANSTQMSHLENNLQQAVVGLSGLTTESKNQQNHLLSASYLGWPEQLFDQLNQLSKRSDITFNVVSFNHSKLTLSIK